MALNVTGFPLEFDAVINTDNLATGVQSIKDNLKNLTDPLKAALDAVDNNLAQLLAHLKNLGADPSLEQLFTKYADLQKQAIVFQDSLSKATDPTNVSSLNEKLADTKTQIVEIGKQIAGISGGSLAPKIEVKAELNDADLIQSVDAAKAKLQELMLISTDPMVESFTHANSAVEVLTDNLKNLKNARETATPERGLFLDKDIANTERFLDAAKEKLKSISDQIVAMPPPVIQPAKITLELNKDQLQQDLKGVDDGIQAMLSAIAIKAGSVNPVLEQLILKFGDLQKQNILFSDELSKTTDPEKVKLLNETLADTAREMANVSDQIQAGPDGEIEKTVQAYTRLRQLKQEMASVDPGSQQFKDMEAEAVGLQQSIERVNRGLQIATTNGGGLKAIEQGVRGLIGGFQALAGAVTLFGGSAEETDKATKAVIGAMGILNGLTEVAAVLDKNSTTNIFLKSLAHKENTASIVAETVAQGTQVAVQEAGVVATETATVAQVGLNAAMLANPVGIILGSLVAIYAAYEIYARTLGKVTDAEKERAAAIANTKEVTDKAIDGYVKEEAGLNSLVATAKNEMLTRKQRQSALDEMKTTYPGYLANLSLENISTDKSNILIGKQIELLKAKATAQASEAVYSDKLKGQIKIQNEIDRLQAGGELSFGQSVKAALNQFAFDETPVQSMIRLLKGDLKEAMIGANAAFDGQTDAATKLAEAHQSDADKLDIYVKSLQSFIDKSDLFTSSYAKMQLQMAKQQPYPLPPGSSIAPFDQKEFDKEKQAILAVAQYRIDVDKNSYDARKGLINDTYNEELKRIQGLGVDVEAQTKVAKGKLLSSLNDLNEEYRQKDYQRQVDVANSVVTMLTAKGKEGTEAFYNAREVSVRASAAKELDAARSSATDTKHIYAQLALDLATIENDRQKKRIENEKAAVQANINQVKEGSKQELALKISLISLESQEELKQLSLSQQEKERIQTDAAKKVSDLNKAFVFQGIKDEEDVRLSALNTQLAAVEEGSKEELEIRKKLVVEKALLDIVSTNNSITNERVKLAKIAEINAKSLEERRKLEKDYETKILADQLQAIQNITTGKNATLDLIVNDKSSTSGDVFAAKKQQIQNELDGLTKETSKIGQNIILGQGDAKALEKQLDASNAKIRVLQLQLKNLDTDAKYSGLTKAANDIDALAAGFGALAQGAQGLNDNLSKVIGTLSNIASGVTAAIDGFKKMKEAQDKGKGHTGEAIGAAIGAAGAALGVVSSVVGFFKAQSDAAKEAASEIQRYKDSLITGQVDYNQLLRQQALNQKDINALTFTELETKRKLLALQKQQAQADYDALLKQIELQGKQITGEHTERKNVITGGSGKLGLNLFGKKQVVQDLADLGDINYDQLEKLFTQGKLDEGTAKWFQELKKVHDELDSIGQSAADVEQQQKELYTATTSDAILDSIVKGFSEGKRATADFADNFQDLMRQSILNAFKYKALEKPIQDFYDSFAAATQSDDQLTQSEIQQLQQQYDAIIKNAGIQFDQLTKLTNVDLTAGTDSSGGNSLKGAIKGITEQQAELLAGQFGGLRITAISQLQTAQTSLVVLNKIENNTSRIANVEAFLRKFDNEGIKIK